MSIDRLGVTPSSMPRTPFSPTTELATSMLPEVATRVTLSKKVLILEDNSTNAKVALTVLGRMVNAVWVEKSEDAWLALTGHAFIAYNPSKRVHEMREATAFDCALIDFDLTTSLMQGPDLLERLRRHELAASLSRLPAFTFTSHYDRSEQHLSSEHAAVFSGIVLKPLIAAQVWSVFCEVFKTEIEASKDPASGLGGASAGEAGR
jgi:CheY-like chemotaxis protein